MRDALLAQGIAEAQGLVRIAADPAIEMEARVCVPLLGAGRRWGYLWIIEDRPLTQAQLREVARAAAEARDALAALAERDAPEQARAAAERELVAALLRGEAEADAVAADPVARRLRDGRALTVCVAAPGAGASEAARARLASTVARLRRRAVGGAALCAELDGRWVCIVPAGGAPSPGEALADGGPVLVGEGSAEQELAGVPRSHRRALVALEVAAAHGEVARWDELGPERLLGLLPRGAREELPAGVARLLAPEHATLRLSLEAFLDRAGDVKATAEALGLHRTGVYHRLRRVEELAGVDLRRGEDRLLCHIALRLAR